MPQPLAAVAIAAIVLLAALADGTLAQRDYRDNGDQYEQPGQGARAGKREANVAGDFDYYALVMSWSPTYCAEASDDNYDPQCDRQDGRRYAFVLHGLWPQYERGWPERCWTRKKPFVPQDIIESMLDIMPSPKLVIHEFKKHGTCSGLEPKEYYAASRSMFRQIRIPSRYVNPQEVQMVDVEELEDELIEENPGLQPDMISIVCGGSGNRLREVRICFSKDGRLAPCGPNEDQRKLCNAQRKMFVPPVRSSAYGPDSAEDREKAKPSGNPRPRVIEGVRAR